VVRAFVRLREVLASNTELAKRLDDLEQSTERAWQRLTLMMKPLCPFPSLQLSPGGGEG